MARVFLSHASPDKPVVRRIATALRAAGHDPWLDEDEILIGECIPVAVERALRDSDFVVLCLSEVASKRGWIDAERYATLMQQLEERNDRILPVRLEEVAPSHLIASIAYVDLFPGERAFAEGIARLIRSIDAHQGRREAAVGGAARGETAAQAEPIIGAALPSASPARRISAPTPSFANAEALGQQLENARVRKQKLSDAGISSDEVNEEILRLRRQLRRGGQLHAGDALGDGRYLLRAPVGRGGFAVVWEAVDLTEQRRVAIKVLHSHFAADSQRRERFFRGARVMMDLSHPAVVRVYDPRGEDDAFCYFVMELVPGGNLRDAVLSQRVEAAWRLPLILQVAEALAEAHRRNLVHRDIKPANILLDEHGNAKLTDFDLVGAQDTTGGTRTGALGTVIYAAPECLDKPQNATARADVFGLGMTAIFCLHGRDLPIETFRNPEATIDVLGCSQAVRLVLQRAVKWTPDSRFEDATAMLDALRAASNVATPTATDALEVLPTTNAPQRRRWWRYTPMLAAFGTMALVIFVRLSPEPRSSSALALNVKIQQSLVWRSEGTRVGDVAYISASGRDQVALRIYRNQELLGACPGGKACLLSDDAITVMVTLAAVGVYTVVALAPAAALSELPGTYDQDVAAAVAAGSEIRQETIDVR